MAADHDPVPADGGHWFEPLADHLGSAYLRYSFTKGTGQEIDALLAMVDLGAGARVLDVGCGPGRHSLELARRGFDVTGVDISQTFVDLARSAAEADGLDRCRFLRLDGRHVGDHFAAEFDLVLSLCQGGFGLTGGPGSTGSVAEHPEDRVELDEPMLAAMAQAIRSSGRVVVSAFSAYFQLRQVNGESDDGPEDEFDAVEGVNHEWTSILDAAGATESAELWTTCYTPRELRLLARAVGLSPLAVYGVTPGRYGPYRPSLDCPEFLLVAGRVTR